MQSYGLKYAESTPSVTPSTHTRRRRVQLSQVWATQPYLVPDKVAVFNKPGKGGRPTVREQDGKILLKDGHHRIAGALRRGQRSLVVDEYL